MRDPLLLVLSLAFLQNGCTTAVPAVGAIATLKDKDDVQIGGATLSTAGETGSVSMRVSITKASPGKHGLHIHEGDRCDRLADFMTAMGHFNPDGKKHGDPLQPEHHAGDFGNLSVMLVGADGTGVLEMSSSAISLKLGAQNSVIGKTIIFHDKEDDLLTDPTGNAGARLGCGQIVQARSE